MQLIQKFSLLPVIIIVLLVFNCQRDFNIFFMSLAIVHVLLLSRLISTSVGDLTPERVMKKEYLIANDR